MDPLQTSVQYVKGVGPRLAALLLRRDIRTVSDLLFHFPFRYIDRRDISNISKTEPGKERTVIGEVITSGVSYLGKKRSRIFEVVISDGSAVLSAKWFHFNPKYMQETFKKGVRVLFAGELTEYKGMKQFVHPETEILGDDDPYELGGRILPIYPLTEGISQKMFRKILKNAREKYEHEIKDPYGKDLADKFGLMGFNPAVSYLHDPPADAVISDLNGRRTKAHRTIIMAEFFILELALAVKKANVAREVGIPFAFDENIHGAFLKALPFELTDAQKKVISEIRHDMARPHPMNRLLQGDVGSGKTIVGLAAALQAISAGYQAAYMAPTEILAEQHYKNIAAIAERLNIPCAMLTANVKGELREKIYEGVKKGSIKLLIGTHAVIQSEVKFARLGLAIIDEQHRFGVVQRQAMHKKGVNPDILVMTATPIPRTLAMTLYGDLEVSILDQLPAGRRPVLTKVYTEKQRERLYKGMRVELERGHQIYVVYPLIEESEKIDLKNATEMSQELSRAFSPDFKVELLHGKMKPVEKDTIMQEFKAGRVHVLATTSVVEVGVDVANATVMVIEHAERFGLAQLHQLRGRVGRSNIQSFCILVAGGRLTDEGRMRLNVMVETNDGFKIAEEDLRIRGPGEFLGTRQSGIPEFKLANIIWDSGILQVARQAAFETVLEDPRLELPKNKGWKDILNQQGRMEFGKVA